MDNYVITIAREYGSGGKTIGKMLADHLGIPCYDMEILRMASDDSGINEQLFATESGSTPYNKRDRYLCGFEPGWERCL